MNLFRNPKVTLLIVVALLLGALFVVTKTPPTLGLDLSGGTRLTLEAVPPDPGQQVTSKTMDALYTIIQKRVDRMGVSEAIVQRSGDRRLLVEIPGEQDPERAKERIGKTGLLEFRTQRITPEGEVIWEPSGVSGRDLASADIAPDGANGWVVTFQLNEEGTRKFRELTQKLVVGHQPLGIYFDGELESAPSVQSAIVAGSGQITGNFTHEEAKLMADTLNAGALPMDIEFIEESTVGPLLGKASIEQSFYAGIGGLVLVLIFMIAYYRFQGVVADMALVVYTLLTYAAYNLLGVTFTLAGIAGFILSIGMAVDANILIFERTKEEIKSGRSLHKAIEVGFDRAFPSIFDSNTTTIITCVLLYILGTGAVKGFAITLAIGVLVSMFSAITVTRSFLHLILGPGGQVGNPTMFGVKPGEVASKS